jgi:hypothetical protein
MKARRPAARPRPATKPPEHDNPKAVSARLAGLDPTIRAIVKAIRTTILAADARVTEGIKWNSVSFYCYGWFATIRDNAKSGVQVIIHLGAKGRADSSFKQSINDSGGLLTWLGPDRAMVTFQDLTAFRDRRTAFLHLVQQWVKHQATSPMEAKVEDKRRSKRKRQLPEPSRLGD